MRTTSVNPSVSAGGKLVTDPFLKLEPITATDFLGVSDLGGEVFFENDSPIQPSKHLTLGFGAVGGMLRRRAQANIFAGT